MHALLGMSREHMVPGCLSQALTITMHVSCTSTQGGGCGVEVVRNDLLLTRVVGDGVCDDVDDVGVGDALHDGRFQRLAIPHDDCCQVIDDLHRGTCFSSLDTVTK